MPVVMKTQSMSRALVLDPTARIRQLSEHGSSVGIDKAIPVKRYFRSGSEMERQARVYYTEGQLDRAFMLYNKFATLFIEKLPKHPEYSKAPSVEKSRIKKLLKQALTRAMELKEKLKVLYEKEKEDLERTIKLENEAQAPKEQEPVKDIQADEIANFLSGKGGVVPSVDNRSQGTETTGGDVTITEMESFRGQEEEGNAETVEKDYVMNVEYPTQVEPAQQEQQSDKTGQAGLDDFNVQACQGYVSYTQADLTAMDPRLAQVLPESAGVVGATPPMYYQGYEAPPPSLPPPSAPPPSALPPSAPPYSYQTQQPTSTVLQQPTYEGSTFQSPYAPTQSPVVSPTVFPPYSTQPTSGFTAATPTLLTTPTAYEEPSGSPTVDRSSKPESFQALSTGFRTGVADVYRPLHIPTDTATRFEEVASPNTRRNVETCGILAGKLSHDNLRITHIIVPKQKGKSDSCETFCEEELFDVQDQYDLITLGWIHTHPTQTAFMSSVDLHCHCSYQVMMDEAVAIVVAPKYQQVGYYMLTEPHGLNYITHCEEEGFHVHPKVPPLYEDCKHIHHDASTFIQIVDLR